MNRFPSRSGVNGFRRRTNESPLTALRLESVESSRLRIPKHGIKESGRRTNLATAENDFTPGINLRREVLKPVTTNARHPGHMLKRTPDTVRVVGSISAEASNGLADIPGDIGASLPVKRLKSVMTERPRLSDDLAHGHLEARATDATTNNIGTDGIPPEDSDMIVGPPAGLTVLATAVKPNLSRSLISLPTRKARGQIVDGASTTLLRTKAGGDLELMGEVITNRHPKSVDERRENVFTHRGTLDTVERGEDDRKERIIVSKSQEAILLKEHRFLLDASRPIALALEATAKALSAGDGHRTVVKALRNIEGDRPTTGLGIHLLGKIHPCNRAVQDMNNQPLRPQERPGRKVERDSDTGLRQERPEVRREPRGDPPENTPPKGLEAPRQNLSRSCRGPHMCSQSTQFHQVGNCVETATDSAPMNSTSP